MKILFFTVHAAFFVSHRLNLAKEAKQRGYDVLVLYGKPGSEEMTTSAIEKLDNHGIKHHELNFNSRSLEIRNIFNALIEFRKFIINYQPSIIHAISSMPILIATITSYKFACKRVFAISGLGAVAHSRFFIMFKTILSLFSKNSDTYIFQNDQDKKLLPNLKGRIIKILGSGTPIKRLNIGAKQRIVFFAGRLMKKKGIDIFCKVASLVKKEDPTIKFVLAGSADYDHQDALSLDELKNLDGFSSVKYIGYKEEISPFFEKASIVLYPSKYAEGLSKTLIESSMNSCCIITFDREGCKETVDDGVTGVLLEDNANANDFAEEVLFLLDDKNSETLNKFMINANKKAQNLFSLDSVTRKHMNIYEQSD